VSSLRYIFSSGASGRPYCRDENEGFRFRTKDNTCAVFEDSKLIYASESERFTKIKHDYSLPYQNLETFERYYLNSSNKKIETVQFDWTSHHDCHIFECFYQSGFNEAAVLVNDGCGNLDESITLAYMKQGETPVILKKFERENSLCGLYRFASDAVFNQKSNCEGKFMGLAGYGKDNGSVYAEWDDKNKEIVVHKDLAVSDGKICMERATRPDDVMGSKDYAYSVQRDFEHVLVEVVKYFRELLDQNNFQTKNLCMSGGGVLNCPANSKIVDLGLFDNYYASPQPSDGCAESIGKFFKIMHENGEIIESKRLETAYLGLTYPIEMLPGKKEFIEQRIGYISEFLESGGVVAWYQEGAEYGPRALGHRSFLADPTKQQMLDDLNKIKGREAWRPLAPIVPEELFNRIFEVDNTDMCEFMLRTLKIKER
jgi:carbamoyltransferase